MDLIYRMPERIPPGLLIVGAGVTLVVVGLLVLAGAFAWFGKLPGDIRIERPGFRFYFPLVSMLLISLVVSLVLAIARRW